MYVLIRMFILLILSVIIILIAFTLIDCNHNPKLVCKSIKQSLKTVIIIIMFVVLLVRD